MKRPRHAEPVSDDDDENAFDDGDDLMARAAEMMDFDDETDDDETNTDSAVDDDAENGNAVNKDNGFVDGNGEARTKKARLEEVSSSNAPDMVEMPDELRSTLQLQIDALLSSVRCPARSSTKAKSLSAFLDSLQHVLQKSPALPARPAMEAVAALKHSLPLDERLVDLSAVNWSMAFEPPANVTVGGSWPLASGVKWKGDAGWSVDVFVEMPSILFQEKDVRDFRYLYKRSFFLANLKQVLEAAQLPVEVRYTTLASNDWRPIIELRPTGTGGELDFKGTRSIVRIIPCFDWKSFPGRLSRLLPDRDNLRNGNASTGEPSPTPRYNATIAADGLAIENQNMLAQVLSDVPSFSHAVALLKIWSLQRGHQQMIGLSGIHHVWTILLSHLVAGPGKGPQRLSSRGNAWQLFTGCLNYLASVKDVESLRVYPNSRPGLTINEKDFDWGKSDCATLTDLTGTYNVLQGVPPASLEYLRYEARLSVRRPSETEDAFFKRCFMTPFIDQPHLRFDYTARISASSASILPGKHDVRHVDAAFAKVSLVLSTALGNRVRAIYIQSLPSTSPAEHKDVFIGFHMNPENAARIIEHGPPADDVEAAQRFKAFWGSKSETRRFKDGRILESVVWDAEGPAERAIVFVQIVQHILNYHLAIPHSATRFSAGAYDSLLLPSPQIRKALYTADTADTGFSPVMAAFDYLSKELRALSDVPLKVTSVLPVAPELRYSSTFVPGAYKVKSLPYASTSANFVPVMDCVIGFEGSGRWPEDLEAIQKIKAAFMAKIGESLTKQMPGSRCIVAAIPMAAAEATQWSLEVTIPQGYTFRLQVAYARERLLLENSLLDGQLDSIRKSQFQRILLENHLLFSARPSHHAAIAVLQRRFNSYSWTVRIFKRWLAAHLLARHVSEETLELLVACAYLQSDMPHPPPTSGAAGFARVLQLLAEWDWRDCPLSVPMYTSPADDVPDSVPIFPVARRKEVDRLFALTRARDPAYHRHTWIIATEQDMAGQIFSRDQSSAMVAARIQHLAQACLVSLRELAVQGSNDIYHLFTTPVDTFDFELRLDVDQVGRHAYAVKPDTRSLTKRPRVSQPIRPGYDAVSLFLRRAETMLEDRAELFYDINGGTTVYGLVNPSLAKKGREFRIALDFPSSITKPADKADKAKTSSVHLDTQAILHKLVELSQGLVKSAHPRS